MNASKVAGSLRRRIGRFSGDLSKDLCLKAQRFVSEMVYGIQASESVMLTKVARTLEVPDFKYYALADGMRAIFARHPGAPLTRIRGITPKQMSLFALDAS